MKKAIKKFVLKFLLTKKEVKRLHSDDVSFPGGLSLINNTLETDVFIVGFPKSGNTLMQHLITHLVYGLNAEGTRTLVNLIVPDMYTNSHYFRFNERCFFKSHDLPKPEYKKVIYIMRDGREALLSYYHMLKNTGEPVDLDDLYTEKVKFHGTTWSEHIEQWERNPFDADILWIRFEDLIANKIKELKRICEFLNIQKSEVELKQVVTYTSLEHMKSLEGKTDWASMKSKSNFMTGSFVRKGKIKSYSEEVSPEVIKSFEVKSKSVLERHYNV